MADKKISDLTALTGANVADTDLLPIVDTSATETKKITFGEFKSALDTATGFVRITGDTMTGNLSFGDNNKATFGAGSDLQIYHDGSNSYVNDQGTGDLILRGSTGIKLQSASGVVEFLSTNSGTGALTLASTNFTGAIDVTGTVTADGLTVDGSVAVINGNHQFFSGATYGASQSGLSINNGGASANYFKANNIYLQRAGGENTLFINSGGDISFYEATGTTPKFFWDASAESLGIGTSSPVEKLYVNSTSGDARIGLNAPTGSDTEIKFSNNSVVEYSIGHDDGTDNFVIGTVNVDTPLMSVTKAGNVGIGTTTPTEMLTVTGGNIQVDPWSRKIGYKLSGNSNAGYLVPYDASGYTSLVNERSTGAILFKTGVALDERVRIDSSGNVGIGTSSPATALDVTGTTTSDQYLLDAISDTIASTAVDVFVYDTSKDSDGGAWRKRTQGTSWYNETLGTSTRGSRKEFPAVAVIVAEAATVTIYDGDDPAMPMWMVFNTATGYHLSHSPKSSVKALNGTLAIGIAYSVGQGLVSVCFIKDSTDSWNSASHFIKSLPISGRNSVNTTTNIGVPYLVNNIINDVAMTVLPNAPIDAATGLPVPTIAVATAGGVSVIKDDGTVVDINTVDAKRVTFYDENKRLILRESGSACSYGLLPTVDQSNTSWREGFFNKTTSFPSTLNQTNQKLYSNRKLELGVPSDKGVSLIDVNGADQATSTGAYITSSYNTGWMNGDIKGAFLSDTDATSVVGSGELVTNGDFASNTTGWTAVNGATLSVVSGQLVITSDGSAARPQATQTLTGLTIGSTYVLSGQSKSGVNNPSVELEISGISSPNAHSSTSLIDVQQTFVAYQTSHVISAKVDNSFVPAAGTTAIFDNISVKIAEADRSVNNKGLQVFGTITKTAVATGADLVAYSGFSASNYLEQPYNSGLDFGTGDFCIMGWFNQTTSTSTQYFAVRSDGSSNIWQVGMTSTNDLLFIIDGSIPARTAAAAYADNTWNQVVFVRESGAVNIYINGSLTNNVNSGTNTTSVDLAASSLYIGDSPLNDYFIGSLALLRISATAPTAAQIAKIYNDEKYLFQDGAQATLYGASDAVTALAYDDATDLLHVGTSAGRSVFQGLRRVSNTTTAVGTAISASNGLVVEE